MTLVDLPTSDEMAATDFKTAFRRYATGVAVITAVTPDGPVGLTASSVASVSAEPTVVSFSVATAGRSATALLGTERMSVHLLASDQADVARAFATSGAPRFTAVQGWDGDRLPGALATLDGVVRSRVPLGEATLVVLEIETTTLGSGVSPMVHHDRTYWSLVR